MQQIIRMVVGFLVVIEILLTNSCATFTHITGDSISKFRITGTIRSEDPVVTIFFVDTGFDYVASKTHRRWYVGNSDCNGKFDIVFTYLWGEEGTEKEIEKNRRAPERGTFEIHLFQGRYLVKTYKLNQKELPSSDRATLVDMGAVKFPKPKGVEPMADPLTE